MVKKGLPEQVVCSMAPRFADNRHVRIPLGAHPTPRPRPHPHFHSLSGSPALSPIFPRLWRQSRLSVIQQVDSQRVWRYGQKRWGQVQSVMRISASKSRYSAMNAARSMPLAVPFRRSTPLTSSSSGRNKCPTNRVLHGSQVFAERRERHGMLRCLNPRSRISGSKQL